MLLESVLLSALCFGGLVFGAIWLVHHLVAHGSLGWFAGALGGLLGVLAAVWLFVPIALVIAGLFLEPVCRAVERRWYPDLPPPQPASLIAQSGDLLVLGLQVLLLSVVAFFLSLIFPGVGHILGWLVTAWAFGRGLFAAVAMRRMIRRQALARYSANRAPVLLHGALLTLMGSLPPLNLLLPVLGPAVMVHLVEASRHEEFSKR